MATPESSLDLLSKAAALVNRPDSSMAIGDSSVSARMSPSKELPTKGQKVKRSRSRRSIPGVNSTTTTEKTTVQISPPSDSKKSDPGLLSFAHIFPKRDARDEHFLGIKSCSTEYPPPPPYPHSGCRTSPRVAAHFDNNYKTQVDDVDMELPLDMSKKCSTQSESQAPVSRQQHRPSVITCTSTLLKTKCQHQHEKGDNSKYKCPCNSDRKSGSESDSNSCEEIKDSKPGHRREMSSGMCDPVIDEHFRRSLGKDYSEIFASTTNSSVSVTVDDHFAKALGDTWLRLQKPKEKDCKTTTTNNSRVPVVKSVSLSWCERT